MTITPQGQLYLCKTKLENDYKNQLTFSNASAQLTYFNSTIQHTFDNYTYMKKDNVINVGKNIDEIIDCNYLFYRNVGFSSKYYYCFITRMEYVNENCTAIHFETDCFQTWQFDITYNKCFVEREHVSDDTVGLHTVPEGLETGEYIQQKITDNITGFNFYTDSNNHEPKIVLGVSETGLNVALPSGSMIYNGIYSGLIYLVFPTFTDCDVYIRYIQRHITEDVIYTAFMCPASLCPPSSGYTTFTDGSVSFQYDFISYSTVATYMKSASITKPTVLDANYTPKNKKLLTYPYCYLVLNNNAGASQMYKYEDFTNINGTTRTDCPFEIYGALGVGCSIKIYPIHYKQGKGALNTNQENYIEGLDGGKFPTCGWRNDAYTNWLTANAVNIGLSLAGDVISMGTGLASGITTLKSGKSTFDLGKGISGASGGLGEIIGTVASVYQHSLTPETAKGGTNQGDLNYAMKLTYTPYKMSIKEEYAKIIDNFFSMFGYKVNVVKVPNITGRTNWNYVKTIDCNFTGDIPQEDLNIIRSAFNNGITLWHNASTMYNYGNSNNITS